jgi:hypothetical protein
MKRFIFVGSGTEPILCNEEQCQSGTTILCETSDWFLLDWNKNKEVKRITDSIEQIPWEANSCSVKKFPIFYGLNTKVSHFY